MRRGQTDQDGLILPHSRILPDRIFGKTPITGIVACCARTARATAQCRYRRPRLRSSRLRAGLLLGYVFFTFAPLTSLSLAAASITGFPPDNELQECLHALSRVIAPHRSRRSCPNATVRDATNGRANEGFYPPASRGDSAHSSRPLGHLDRLDHSLALTSGRGRRSEFSGDLFQQVPLDGQDSE
jgi:hypothetical protein